MINPLVAGFLQSTIMSTCAWTATTLPLRKGQETTQYFTQLFLSFHLINPQRRSGSRDHLGWGWRILCHQLSAGLSRPDQEIPGKDVTQISYYIIYHQVAVPDDFTNNTQHSELIGNYQGLSKKPPELEKFGPIIELINTKNMKPAQVKQLGVLICFYQTLKSRVFDCQLFSIWEMQMWKSS